NACSSPDGFITLRNVGQITTYNLQVTETLPPNLLYVSGSTRWRLNGGSWNVDSATPPYAYDPSPTTSPLVWTSNEISGLATALSGDTIEIEFEMTSDCSFSTGDITVSTQYENPCADVFTTSDSTFTAAFNEPEIIVTKTRADNPIGCTELVEWEISVTNNSGYLLPVIWVEDTLGGAYTFDSASVSNYASDNGTNVGQTITWELKNVPTSGVSTITLTATSDSATCNSDLDNTASAWWGCGDVDGSSTTKPGVDAPDDVLCLATLASDTATRSETREPDVGFLSIGFDPANIDACNDSTEFTVTLENPGPTDASDVDLVIALPDGLSYNAGSAAITCGGGITDPAAEPVISGATNNILTFYDITDDAVGKADNLCDTIEASGGNDTVVLQFSVQSSCYVEANVNLDLYYYDCCSDTQYSTSASQPVTAQEPDLSITKTPADAQVDCGAGTPQTWTITVTNNGDGNAQVVRIEDTPGDWIDIRTGQPSDPIDMGGGVYGWEINDLAAGNSVTFDLVGVLNPDGFPNQSSCDATLRQNNVQAIWGCGIIGDAIDSDPTTTADYDCLHTDWATAPTAILLMPDLVVTDIAPTFLCDSGGFSGYVDVTVQNQGDGTVSQDFDVTITEGAWSNSTSYIVADAGNGAIGPNETRTIRVDLAPAGNLLTPDCASCRTYDFSVEVDSNTDICECDEDNSIGPQTFDLECAEIGDLVWHDINGDGIQNDGAGTGVPNVDIYLLDQDGDRVLDENGDEVSTTTDVNGEYIFENLIPGNYGIEFDLNTLPSGYSVSPQNQGGDDGIDSDGDSLSGQTSITTLDPNESDMTWDLGIFHPVSIGNYVWFDRNADGVQNQYDSDNDGAPDTDEEPIAGVEVAVEYWNGAAWVTATHIDGSTVDPETTNGQGQYNFTNLPPGEYRVEVVQTNWTGTGVFNAGTYAGAHGSPGQGGDDGVDDTVAAPTQPTNLDDNGNNDG
ncbi:MAG: hypothetical protein GY794_00520, partial [bacterium]|nr:hypothetical protein [bacterium]